MLEDLKIIKNKYGEKMMHLCRQLFPTILEHPSILSNILLEHFYPTRFLYQDIIENDLVDDFVAYVYEIFNNDSFRIETNKTPTELLSKAGYDLYECKTNEDIQRFKKYYAEGEELCTFNGNRLDDCYVFFAVKKDVDEIKREDFPNPKRQDLYGTSVISIQYTKGESTILSIKNRYNHKVVNPDATFSNNLDNIIPGLTNSFENEYGLIQQNKEVFEIPGYVLANDGRFYKYNYEINNIYYCPYNIIIDNFEVKKYDLEKYIVLDYFILNLSNGELRLYDTKINDCFPNTIPKCKNVQVYKENDIKKVIFTTLNNDNIIIVLDDKNNIIGLQNNIVKEVEDGFLKYNTQLQSLNMESLKKIGDYFLYFNVNLRSCKLLNVEVVGSMFIMQNIIIESVTMPKLRIIGDEFLTNNKKIRKLNFPELEKIGSFFLEDNCIIDEIYMPKVEYIGTSFLSNGSNIIDLSLPKLIVVEDNFLDADTSISHLNLPCLQKAGSYFMCQNNKIVTLNIPNLKEVGPDFLTNNVSNYKLICQILRNIYLNSSNSEMTNEKLRKI